MIWKKAALLSLILLFTGFVLTGVSLQAVAEDDESSDLDTIIINNEDYSKKRRGPVRFTHKKHARDYQVSCWQCHHVYDEKQQKLIAADGMEAMCADCHELKKRGNTPGLRKAYHGRCNKCHRKMKKLKKPSGPSTCGECHKK